MKTVSILENIYYGNIDPHEHSISGGDKDELIENVVQLETKLRATLTEQQKILLEQLEKADAEVPTDTNCRHSQLDFDWPPG